eukprot:gene4621-5228_t
MSSEHGKWETVVNKKKGQVSKNDVRKAKERFRENPMHAKADYKNPLEEGDTIYSAVFDNTQAKENKKPEEKYPSFHHAEPNKKGNVSPGKQLPKQKKHPKPKPCPLADAKQKIEKLNGETLSEIIKTVQDRFPSHCLVWLKEVALWLQKELAGPAEKDLMLSSQPKGFPENLLTGSIRDQLKSLLKKSTDQSFEMLFCFGITQMLSKSTIGIRILMQLLIERLPKVLISKMDEVLSGKAISQESFLVVIWAYSQSYGDLSTGIKVWWKVMHPVLRVGTHAPHIVNYIEELLKRHAGAKFPSPVLDGKQFLDVLSIVFSNKSPLANMQGLKQRFERMYPTLKRMYFSDKPEQTAVDRFKFLLQTVVIDDPLLQLEVLHLLISCLSYDPNCFGFWLKNLEKYLKPSSVLWGHIHDHFNDVHKEIYSKKKYKDRSFIQRQSEQFFAQLLDIKRKGFGSKVGFADCYNICQQFQRKTPTTTRSRLTMLNILKYMFLGMLAFTAFDLYCSSGYKGSRTESVATNLGIDAHASAVFIQLEKGAAVMGHWSKQNIHPYYAQVHAYLEPTMELAWNHTVRISNSAYEFSKPALEYLSKTTQVVLVKIDEVLPGYMDKVSENAKSLWDYVFPTIHHYISTASAFISTNAPIVIDNVSKSLSAAIQWTYQLHPSFFDSALMYCNSAVNCLKQYAADVWGLLVVYTPIVMEACVRYVNVISEAIQDCVATGQVWLQNMLRATNGGSNAAS